MANQTPSGLEKNVQPSSAVVTDPPGYKIDWFFIRGVEDKKTIGYVPLKDDSKSGVSIATGFDIGQHNKRELVSLGLPDALVKKLAPYCLMIKDEAANYLRKHPLTITGTQADLIDRAQKNFITEKLEREYNAESAVPFQTLPAEAQTAIMSVEFQYGTISAVESKQTLWTAMTKQQWKEAIRILHGKSRYRTRRDKEAALLQKVLDRERKAS